MPCGRACANGSVCQPCHTAGTGGPRHDGQSGRGALQPAGRLDGPARAAAGHPAAGVQRCAVFGGNHEPDRPCAEPLAQGAALAGTDLRRTAVCVDLPAAAVHAVCSGRAGRTGGLLLARRAAAALSARGGALHSAGRGTGVLDAARCCANQSGRRVQQSLRCLRAERAGCGVLPRRREQLERRAELSGRAQQAGARAGRGPARQADADGIFRGRDRDGAGACRLYDPSGA